MIRINLLEVREERRRLAMQTLIATAVIVWVVTLGILATLHLALLSEIEGVRQDTRRDQEEVARLQKIVGEVEKEQGRKKEIEGKLEIIRSLELTRGELVSLMTGIAETMPQEVWAREMELLGRDVSMKASAIDMQSIGSYVKMLKADSRFVDPQTSDIKVNKAGTVDFTLRVKVAVPAGAEVVEPEPAKGARRAPSGGKR